MVSSFIASFDLEFDFEDPCTWFAILEECLEDSRITNANKKGICLFECLPLKFQEDLDTFVGDDLLPLKYEYLKNIVLCFLLYAQ